MNRFVLVVCSLLATLVLGACAEGDNNAAGSGSALDGCVDLDRDGKYAIRPNCAQGTDCADNDPAIPGPVEIPGDGKDNDCQGGDAPRPNDCTAAVDKDGDGYYDDSLLGTQIPKDCKGPDCNDRDRNILPGGPNRRGEIANNGKDDDCDERTPDDVPNCIDVDGDGFGTQGNNECTGRTPADKIDCDDNDEKANPNEPETCDGKDNDCDDAVDECDKENYSCGAVRKICLGRLNAQCSGNRECDVERGYACHTTKCLLLSADAEDRCFEDGECVTGTCDVGTGKCQEFCAVNECGRHQACPEVDSIEKRCDNAKGCLECVDSSEGSEENPAGGGCPCGLCAGYKCFTEGGIYVNLVDEDLHPEGRSPFLQILDSLVDCFQNKSSASPVLCHAFETRSLGSLSVGEGMINDFVCGDDHAGSDGDRHDQARDMVGCGLFNYDEFEMEGSITGGTFYTTCAWWDGADVRVGSCDDFPANL